MRDVSAYIKGKDLKQFAEEIARYLNIKDIPGYYSSPGSTDWTSTAENIVTTGSGTFGNLDVDTLNLNGNIISDSTGTISFDDDNLTTTGTGTFGTLTVGGGSITDTTDAISFGNEALTTTGDITAANFVTAGNVDGVDVSAFKALYDAYVASGEATMIKIGITAKENIAAGDVVISTAEGYIPESSLSVPMTLLPDNELANEVGGNDTNLCIVYINDFTIAAIYSDVSNGNFGTVTLYTVNADRTVTKGSDYIFSSDVSLNIAATELRDVDEGVEGDQGLAIVWMDEGVDGFLDAIVGRLDHAGLTFGARGRISDVVEIGYASVCRARDDIWKFLAAYVDVDNNRGREVCCSVNMDTLAITPGATELVGIGRTNFIDVKYLEDDKVCAAFADAGDANHGYGAVSTIAGLVITMGTEVEFQNNGCACTSVAVQSSTKVTILFQKGNANFECWGIIGNITGATTLAFPEAQARFSLEAKECIFIRAVAIDATHVFGIWDNHDDSETKYRIGVISDSMITPGDLNELVNDFPGNNYRGRNLAVNSYNDYIYFGICAAKTYLMLFDVAWGDSDYIIYDILGAAPAAITATDTGNVVVDGIVEGEASGLDKQIALYMDYDNQCIRKKDFACGITRLRKAIRNLDTDATYSIGGN